MVVFAIVAFVASFYTSSCKFDKCKSIVCAYGGVCNDGACECKPGYQGPYCETISRNKFLGLWQVEEQGTITPHRYYALSIEVGNGKDATLVKIHGLYNYFGTLLGNVSGDTLTIPNQQMQGKTIFGKGYIFSSKEHGDFGSIRMYYEVVDTATGVPDDFGVYSSVDTSKPSVWIR